MTAITHIMQPPTPSLVAATEKPQHYSYLKDFRVEPCPLFKQHQCQQHRPFTCFYWHFANQKRRRPLRTKDGTFNYSADEYCTKYDENTGQCPDGDGCALLHRVAGDVERKYHLRYFKTCLCVHSTDSKGQCSKYGAHCPFAHGAGDLRAPIFDIRDVRLKNGGLGPEDMENTLLIAPAGSSLPKQQQAGGLVPNEHKTSFVYEDPVWDDANYVLRNYKTEPCKKPPRLCRQGYACPFYHNTRDKRRSPTVSSYRSTACPQAKHGDEWSDPDMCDQGERCSYCHTRTEQQFHPEIYKSTKCNDMLNHGYCPRGPFCAFAHTDTECRAFRDIKPLSSSVQSAASTGSRGKRLSFDAVHPMTGAREIPLSMSADSSHCESSQSCPGTDPLQTGQMSFGAFDAKFVNALGAANNASRHGGYTAPPPSLQQRETLRETEAEDALLSEVMHMHEWDGTTQQRVLGTSAPVSIPINVYQQNHPSRSSTADPHSSVSPSKKYMPDIFDLSSVDDKTGGAAVASFFGSGGAQRSSFEDQSGELHMAQNAIDLWKKQAQDHQQRADQLEHERNAAMRQRDEAMHQLSAMTAALKSLGLAAPGPLPMLPLHGSPMGVERHRNHLQAILESSDVASLPRPICGRCGRQPDADRAGGLCGHCPICSPQSQAGDSSNGAASNVDIMKEDWT